MDSPISTPDAPPKATPDARKSAVPDDQSPPSKLWRVGTLTYTLGGLVVLFFWLLWGDFSMQLKERSVPPTLQLLLTRFHSSDLVLGLLITSLPQTIGLIVTPIVSFQSDRHRSRFGRRIPFLFATGPVALFAMIGLAFSPVIGAWVAHAMKIGSADHSIIVCFGVFWAIFELVSIPVNYVLLPGLINDVVPAELLGRFYGLFRMVSLGAGGIFFLSLMGKVEDHYVPIFITFGAIYATSFVAMCLMVKEGEYDVPVDPKIAIAAAPAVGEQTATGATPVAGPSTVLPYSGPAPKGDWLESVATYFRQAFSQPYYFWFFGSFMLAQMAFTPITTFTIPFAKSVGMSMDTYGKLSFLQLILSLIQAYFIGWLCDKFHALRMTIVALSLYAIATMLAFFFARTAFGFGVAHVVCGSIAGMWYTTSAPLGPALLPKRKFTTMLSANHICVATGMLLIAPACGHFLDVVHGQYRYIFLWASIFMTGSVLVTLMLHQRFMTRGGPKGYLAPE